MRHQAEWKKSWFLSWGHQNAPWTVFLQPVVCLDGKYGSAGTRLVAHCYKSRFWDLKFCLDVSWIDQCLVIHKIESYRKIEVKNECVQAWLYIHHRMSGNNSHSLRAGNCLLKRVHFFTTSGTTVSCPCAPNSCDRSKTAKHLR